MRREQIDQIDLRPTHDRSTGEILPVWEDYFAPDAHPKMLKEVVSNMNHTVARLVVILYEGRYYAFLNGIYLGDFEEIQLGGSRKSEPQIHWSAKGFLRPLVSFVVRERKLYRVFWVNALLPIVLASIRYIWSYEDEPVVCGTELSWSKRTWGIWWKGGWYGSSFPKPEKYAARYRGACVQGPLIEIGYYENGRYTWGHYLYGGKLYGEDRLFRMEFHGFLKREPVFTFLKRSESESRDFDSVLFLGAECVTFDGMLKEVRLLDDVIEVSYCTHHKSTLDGPALIVVGILQLSE